MTTRGGDARMQYRWSGTVRFPWVRKLQKISGELPGYYTIAPLWNKYKDELLAILTHPSIVEQNHLTSRAGEVLLTTVTQLIGSLKGAREELSLKYDIPYVTSTTITSTTIIE